MKIKKAVRTAQTYAAPLLDAKVWTQRQLLRLRSVPSDPSYEAFKFLPIEDGKQFIDVGANRGQTIDSFRIYHRDLPVIAFEPNMTLAQRLMSQYSEDRELTIHPFGLGQESGYFDLFVPYYRGFMFDGLASLDWNAAHDWLNSDRIYGFDSRHLKIEKLRCEVRQWDDVATAPALVKIDVQGYEASVLRGGMKTIREHRPIFLLENSKTSQHDEVLIQEDYRRGSYDSGRMELGAQGKKDTYYIPDEKIETIRAIFS